ncbi:hypothetical protein EG68_00708 [Paragonimus skrjabini miyazakii]|uniref:Carnosine N-methyltransferase n=1 Tax=Paragonimus skrjabini miyazakii TaxID=59628 RepID=A0A8S9ZC88_9TREM|nr:hypothetical protein EG68_00708 [Paragonimus skrjabini miyazakii]
MSHDDGEVDEEREQDREHFLKTVASFRFFGVHMRKKVERARSYYNSLPVSQKSLVPEFEAHMRKVEDCLSHNNDLIHKIVEHSAPDIFNGEHSEDVLKTFDKSSLLLSEARRKLQKPSKMARLGPFAFTTSDMDKIRSTLKQFVRDWSSVGKTERETCYQPVIDDICELYDRQEVNPADVRILVPGAGLGRLAWELAHLGYSCQGNEWSLHMLIPAYFILNTCKIIDEHTLYPWAPNFCNNMSREDQLAPIHFPDVCPADLSPDVPFSMAAGDFSEIYTEPDSWDCIATVFFIDTAHNILAYLETIWRVLKPGGHWVNLGPLLYHFSDLPGEDSLELSYEELRSAIQRIGFEILKENKRIRCGYTENPASMLSYEYRCVYGLFRKPVHSTTST